MSAFFFPVCVTGREGRVARGGGCGLGKFTQNIQMCWLQLSYYRLKHDSLKFLTFGSVVLTISLQDDHKWDIHLDPVGDDAVAPELNKRCMSLHENLNPFGVYGEVKTEQCQ